MKLRYSLNNLSIFDDGHRHYIQAALGFMYNAKTRICCPIISRMHNLYHLNMTNMFEIKTEIKLQSFITNERISDVTQLSPH